MLPLVPHPTQDEFMVGMPATPYFLFEETDDMPADKSDEP